MLVPVHIYASICSRPLNDGIEVLLVLGLGSNIFVVCFLRGHRLWSVRLIGFFYDSLDLECVVLWGDVSAYRIIQNFTNQRFLLAKPLKLDTTCLMLVIFCTHVVLHCFSFVA